MHTLLYFKIIENTMSVSFDRLKIKRQLRGILFIMHHFYKDIEDFNT